MPSPYLWPLDAPVPYSAPPTLSASPSSPTAVAGRPARGLLGPFRRSASDFASAEGSELISSQIRQVLGIRCSSSTTQGELPWLTTFGSLYHHARWRNNDVVLRELLNQWTIDALARWLPKVRVTWTELEGVGDATGAETGVRIRVGWEVISRGGGVLGSGSTSVALPSVARP